MAENNSFTVEYSMADLVKEVAGLKTAMTVFACVGSTAIVAGAVVSWFVITTQLDTNSAIGELKGERSVVVILEDIQKSLKELSTPKTSPETPPAQKQGALTNPSPSDFVGWMGVEAPSKDDLAKALIKTPDTKSPVWVYTNEPAAAEALENALKEQ